MRRASRRASGLRHLSGQVLRISSKQTAEAKAAEVRSCCPIATRGIDLELQTVRSPMREREVRRVLVPSAYDSRSFGSRTEKTALVSS